MLHIIKSFEFNVLMLNCRASQILAATPPQTDSGEESGRDNQYCDPFSGMYQLLFCYAFL